MLYCDIIFSFDFRLGLPMLIQTLVTSEPLAVGSAGSGCSIMLMAVFHLLNLSVIALVKFKLRMMSG